MHNLRNQTRHVQNRYTSKKTWQYCRISSNTIHRMQKITKPLSSLNNTTEGRPKVSHKREEQIPMEKKTLKQKLEVHKEAIAYLLHHIEELKASLKENTKTINELSTQIHEHINQL